MSFDLAIEKQIYNIMLDLGFKVEKKYICNNLIFDFYLEYGNMKYVLEIKSGSFDINTIKKQTQVYKRDLSKEYQLILVFDYSKFSRQEIVSLYHEGVILIDINKFIRIQRDLYYKNDPISFYISALNTERSRKYINNKHYVIQFSKSKQELLNIYESRKSKESSEFLSLDHAVLLQGIECDYGYIYIDNRIAYDPNNHKILMSSNNNDCIKSAHIILSRAQKGNIIYCEDSNLQKYLRNKVIINPIKYIITK